MSWKPAVAMLDDGDPDWFPGKWYENALRFATEKEASQMAFDMAIRWYAVVDWRVIECDDPVNYAVVNNRVVKLP